MDGIMGVVPDFDGLGLDLSFSPIQNRAQTPPSGGIRNVSPPPGFEDMSYGSPASNRGRGPLVSTPLSGAYGGLDNGIQDVSFGGLGGADMSFSPIQLNRRPPRGVRDVSPPPDFQDMSFDAPVGNQGGQPRMDINVRGGKSDPLPICPYLMVQHYQKRLRFIFNL